MEGMSDIRNEIEQRLGVFARPGEKVAFEKEYVLWGLPKGETDRLHEKVLSTQAKTPAQMEDVKKRAAAAGWHSFRVQILDLSKPYKGFSRPGAKAEFAENTYYSVAAHIGDSPAGERTARSLDEAKAYAKAMLESVKANAKGKAVVVDVYPVVNYEPKPAVLTLRASRPGAKAEMAMIPIGTMRRLKKNYDEYLAYLHRNDPKRKPMSFDEFVDEHKESVENSPMFDSNQFFRPGAKAAFDRRIEVDHWTSPKGTKYVAGVHEHGGGTSFQPFISATYSDGGEQLMTGNAPSFKTEKGARKWLATEIGRRKSVASRPGEKSTFASDVDLVMEQARKMHSNWKPIAERDQNKPNAGTRGGVEGYASSAIHFLGNHIRDLKKYSKRADKKEAEAAKAGLKEVADMMKYWEAMYRKVTASRLGVKSTHAASFQIGDKVAVVSGQHMDAYGRILTLKGNRAVVASAEGNIAADIANLKLVKRGTADDLKKAGFMSRPGAKAKFERVDIGDAFEFEGKVYVVNGKASEISALLSSSKNNSEKAMMLASYAYEGTLSYEGKRKMSRPGAKSTMAITPIRVTEAEYAALAARDAVSRKILGDSQYQITPSDRTIRAAGDAAYKTALARHNAWDKAWRNAPNDAARADIEARTEAAESKMRVYRGSRPGAKANMGLEDACWKGYEAVGMKTKDGKDVPNCVPKATAAKPATPAMRELERKMHDLMQKADRLLKQSLSAAVTAEESQRLQDEVERISEQLDAMGDELNTQRKAAGFAKPEIEETEQDKAGLKLMEKADKAVSDKIRTLIKEGKPQDQAVAIALDMKRRGEI